MSFHEGGLCLPWQRSSSVPFNLHLGIPRREDGISSTPNNAALVSSAFDKVEIDMICVVASSCSTKTTLGISSVEYLG